MGVCCPCPKNEMKISNFCEKRFEEVRKEKFYLKDTINEEHKEEVKINQK